MGEKMSNAPVYYALAQVRFNPLAALEQYIPAIQDSLRREGFPDFERILIASIAVSAAPQAAQVAVPPTLQPMTRYSFLDEKRRAGFILDQGMMFYQTTDYDTFNPFLNRFLEGLKVLDEAARLSYTERAGVRFLDAVCPEASETIDQYLVPSVLGIFRELEPRELEFAASETRTKLAESTLMSRVTIFRQEALGAAFPFDLQPVNLTLTERFQSVAGLHAVIDTDSWIEKRETFALDNVEKRLRQLQINVRQSFDLVVTRHAMSVWK